MKPAEGLALGSGLGRRDVLDGWDLTSDKANSSANIQEILSLNMGGCSRTMLVGHCG